MSFVAHLEIDGEVNPKALHKALLQRLKSPEDRIRVLSSSILPEHSPTREEKIVRFQYPHVRFVEGAWVRLIFETGEGKQRRTAGIILNMPMLMLRNKHTSEVKTIPIASIISIEKYAPPHIVKQWEIMDRAKLLAKLIREKEKRLRKIVEFHNFQLNGSDNTA